MNAWRLQPARDLELPLLQGLGSVRRENGLIATGLNHAWTALVRGYLAIWHRLEVNGLENIPAEPPFIMVANHASHLDALILASQLPWAIRDRVFPIAAGDIFFETPVRTTLAALFLNALPIWRKKCGGHALQNLRERLVEEPCAYILFPEGCRSRDGRMVRFKTGLGMLVAGSNVPVVPCYLDGAFGALSPGSFLPRPKKIRLTIGQPLRFDRILNERSGWEQIAAEVQREVTACGRVPATR